MRIIYILLFMLLLPVSVYAEEEAPEPDIEYLEMTPKFTVNLAERKKYLRVNIQLLVEGKDAIDKIKHHFPALRHELIMLFSGLPVADLQTMDQRESLRKSALDTMRETLSKLDNSDGLRDLFFTEFLVN